MKRTKIKTLIVFALLLAANTVQGAVAEKRTDTLEVKFRVGQSDIDLSYADNERRVAEFTRLVQEYYGTVPMSQLKFDIITGASPEGPTELNRRLGEQRGIALRNLLKKRLGEMAPQMAVVNKGARWGELYQMVDKSNEEWREDVLRILSKTPAQDNWRVDPREQELRRLRGGAVWRDLDQRYLPVLRASGMAVIANLPVPQKDTIVIINKDTIYYFPEPIPGKIIDHRPFWAVKTNLLMWGLIAPNVQLEIPLGHKNRWSIEAEVFLPWWTWSHNAHAEQFFDWGLELRYWLGNRERHHTLDGWHIGLAAAMGYYDFEWKRSHGYQGEYINTYLNFGYQKRISTHWAVDCGLGLGYIPTQYREYLGSSVFPKGYEEEYDDHLMWQRTKWKHILGLTHANITIAYMFDPRPKSKRTRLEPLTLEDIDRHHQDMKMQRREAKMQERGAREVRSEVRYATKDEAAEIKARLKAEEAEAKARAKAAEDEAKARAKAEEAEAKAAAKAEKEAAKAAAKSAKSSSAKVVEAAEDTKAAAKAAEAEAKAAEKAAKERAKEEAAAAKAAEQEAKERAKEEAAAAKAAEKEAKERAKEEAAAAKTAEKAAKAKAKEVADDGADAAKAAAAEAKAAEKAAEKAAKAKAKEEAAAAKAAAAQAKAEAKAAAAEAKAAAAEAKAEAKAAAAEAKAEAKAAAAEAKAEKEAAKAAAKAAMSND